MCSFIGLSPINSGTMLIEGAFVPAEFHVDMQRVKSCSEYVKPAVLVTGHITKIDAEIPKIRRVFVASQQYSLPWHFSLNPEYKRSVPFSIVSMAIGPQMACNNCFFVDASLTLRDATTTHGHKWFEGDVLFEMANPDTDWFIEWES